MKRAFKERTDPDRYCLRKIMGAVCMCAGILTIFGKIAFYMVTRDEMIPLDGRGQFLVATGATLLGITSFDTVLSRIGMKGDTS